LARGYGSRFSLGGGRCSVKCRVGTLTSLFCSRVQRLGGLSYFAGAEKKDDRVLVPDLGSLTSIHDR
jgi:hypothetical protein